MQRTVLSLYKNETKIVKETDKFENPKKLSQPYQTT